MIKAKCGLCGNLLGEFEPVNDHGSVFVKCRTCEGKVEIFNNRLMHANPEAPVGDAYWLSPDGSMEFECTSGDESLEIERLFTDEVRERLIEVVSENLGGSIDASLLEGQEAKDAHDAVLFKALYWMQGGCGDELEKVFNMSPGDLTW